jgi:hypothetical protein
MFFKKNKPTPPPEAEHQVAANEPALSGQSLFAPGLNPNAAPIDFGFNQFSSPANGQVQMSSPAIQPWEPEAWKAPAAPGLENWSPPETTAPLATVVSPFEPNTDWEAAIPQPQAPLPFTPPLEASEIQAPGLPVPDMTPEQAWSSLEPVSPLMPAELEGGLSEAWAYTPPEMPLQPESSPSDAMAQDWAAAFEETSASDSVSLEPPVQLAPPLTTPEMGLAWAEGSPTYAEEVSPVAQASFYPVEDSFFSETAATLQTPGSSEFLETFVPPLDAVWSEPSLETEEKAFSMPPQPQDFVQEQHPAPRITPLDMAPLPDILSFKPTEPVASFSANDAPAFDPVQAAQELASGWDQMEKVSPELAEGVNAVQAMPVEPSVNTWADENMPPPLSQQALSVEWANFSNEQPIAEPVYLHETPSTAESEAALWNNLSMPDGVAPGEQVPMVSGGLMDGINQQLYPPDPFSSLNDEFAAGEQAFAEAAQFLFPETMSAPVEWSDEGYGLSNLEVDDVDTASVVDLGPSYLPQAQGFSQLSNALPSDFPHGFNAPSALNPEAFSGSPAFVEEESRSPDALGAGYEGGYGSITEDAEFGPSPYATDESLDDLFGPSAEPLPFNGSQPVLGYPGSEIEDAAGLAWAAPTSAPYPEQSPALEAPASPLQAVETNHAPWDSLLPDDRSTGPAMEMQTPRLEQSWYTEGVLGADAAPENAPDMLSPAWAPQFLEPSLEMLTPQSVLDSHASADEDNDFYATAYTLNEQGELVPVEDDDLFSPLDPLAPHPVVSAVNPPLQPPPMPWASQAPGSLLPQEEVEPEWFGTTPFSSESVQAQPAYGEGLPGVAWPNDTESLGQMDSTPSPLPPAPDAAFFQPEVSPAPAPKSMEASLSPSADDITPAVAAVSLSAFALGVLMPPPNLVEPIAAAFPVEANLASSVPDTQETSPLTPEQVMAWPGQASPASPWAPAQTDNMPVLSPEQIQAQAQVQAQPVAKPVFQVEPVPVEHAIGWEDAPFGPPSAPQPVALPPEKQVIHPKPLNRKLPSPAQAEDLSTQWYSPEEQVQPIEPPVPATPPLTLTLGNMEVMGLCQLSKDKRLILVHNAGIYALMAQNGQQEPDIIVLKVFEQNPLAYQHTFTAVEEGQAAGQGMYVTQVGTWHGIISTFQDKITLHTELG